MVPGGRVRLSPDAWPLPVSCLVPSRSVPVAICIRAAADAGTSFVQGGSKMTGTDFFKP